MVADFISYLMMLGFVGRVLGVASSMTLSLYECAQPKRGPAYFVGGWRKHCWPDQVL